MEKNCVSYHPNWGDKEKYYIPKGSTKLIIGSMPPQRLCVDKKGCKLDSVKSDKNNIDMDFFYGSKDNFFWNILNYININRNKNFNNFKELENARVENISICREILKNNNIGIIDVVASCIHNRNDNGVALASDNDLLYIKPIELTEILKNNKNINTIFCTSDYVKSLLGIYYAEHIKYDDDKNKSGEITFKGIRKPYKFYILYSPTRRVFNIFKDKRDVYMENYYLLFDENSNNQSTLI